MNSKNPLNGVPRQKHSISFEQNEREEENVETLMRHIREQNKYGDLVVAPDDEVSFDPVDLARRVQAGEEW